MSSEEPFAPDAGRSTPVPALEPEHVVTPRMREAMRATRTWVLLLSFLGFLLGGVMLAFGFFLIAGAVIGTMVGGGMGIGPTEAVLVAVVLPLGSAMYLVPAFLLFRYARHAADFANLGHPEMLVAAIRAQRNFWRVMGILSLIGLVLWIAGLIFVLLTG